MNESSIWGVSVRAWLALYTVGTGLAFLYLLATLKDNDELLLVIVTAVVGFINLSLGYYLGQKNRPEEPVA